MTCDHCNTKAPARLWGLSVGVQAFGDIAAR